MILYKYLAKKYLLYFLYILFTISTVILVIDFVDKNNSYGNNTNLLTIFKISLYRVPFVIQQVLPFIILITSLTTFWNISKTSELTAARSIGYSIWKILTPLIIVAFIIGILRIVLLTSVVSYSYNQSKYLIYQIKNKDSIALNFGKNGLWLREENKGVTLTINSNNIFQKNNTLLLKKIYIYETEKGIIKKHYFAEKATLKNKVLTTQKIYTLNPTKEATIQPSKVFFTSFTVEQIKQSLNDVNVISFWELPSFIHQLKKSGFVTKPYVLYLYKILADPLFFVSMLLLSAIFINKNIRQTKISVLLSLGTISGFILYFLNNLTNAFAISKNIPPVIASWSIPIIIILSSVSVIIHKEDG